MFRKITDVIRANGNAVDAYNAAAATAEAAALSDSERAAGYFLLSAAARECADAYYGQAVQSTVFDHEMVKFEAYVDALDRGFGHGDSERRLDCLSEVARMILSASAATSNG